jgi:thiol:disulfide interchange protein
MRIALIAVFTLALAGWVIFDMWPKTLVRKNPFPAFAAPPPPIKWNKTYAQALAEAKSKHTLIMIDFYTDWCEWCKQLDTDVYPDPGVISAVDRFAPIKLNAEKDGATLAAKYGVDGYPTILLLSPSGVLVSKIGGYEEAEQFASDLNKVSIDGTTTPQVNSDEYLIMTNPRFLSQQP